MTNNRTLSETELDLVSGGLRDNPWSDYQNQQIAKQNGAEGTFGGSLNNILVGPQGPQLGGQPFDPS
jgi:hypothetical protein